MYGKLSSGLLIGIFVISCLTSCQETPPLKLTTRQWAKIDTLFTERLPDLRVEMDSVCDLDYDGRLQLAVDSILKVRRKEETELRKRIQKLQ